MSDIIIIGSGISGLSAALHGAKQGMRVTLIAPFISERSQSVMAAGGVNAVLKGFEGEDSIEAHVADTIKGGCFIENPTPVADMCREATHLIDWLCDQGIVFSRDEAGHICQRPFGGQSYRRTVYAGACTGKQIVTSLVFACRQYECQGLIKRVLRTHFHSALIRDGKCYGILAYDEKNNKLIPYYADAVIMATGGQNQIFGKTTGSTLCDGYAAGKLLEQGVVLRNLEFIQYHPTTIETHQKRMLITEGARGEGGRLYYEQDGRRVYFMEDAFGERGNLMPRDIVSKYIYDAPSQVYLDVTFLGEKCIKERLYEVYDLCMRYLNLDITRESIPVSPSVHFFMGGFAVDDYHKTNIDRLYAVGECASKYHGANRLGGNSLLAALYSGKKAIEGIAAIGQMDSDRKGDFEKYIESQQEAFKIDRSAKSKYPVTYMESELAATMLEDLGITRTKEKLDNGIETVDFYLQVCRKVAYDSDVNAYRNYRIESMFFLAKAILTVARERRETRGAHIREDYPETMEAYKKVSLVNWENGELKVRFQEA